MIRRFICWLFRRPRTFAELPRDKRAMLFNVATTTKYGSLT